MARTQLTIVLAVAIATGAEAQTVTVHREGFVVPAVRDYWRPQWSELPGQKERGGCVTKWSVAARAIVDSAGGRVWHDSAFIVHSIQPQRLPRSTPIGTGQINCDRGQPWYHVHPPHSCTDERSCIPEGPTARWCGPSRDDLTYLLATGAPFALVWCGPREWVFFFPHHLEVRRLASSESPAPSATRPVPTGQATDTAPAGTEPVN